MAIQVVANGEKRLGIAKVVFESPLPQLDRVFEYAVPEHLDGQIAAGVRVLVPFGRNKKPQEAFVLQLSNEAEYDGKLAEVESVISIAKVLPESTYRLIRAVADRQACSLGEVLKLAIPDRSVAVEKKWLGRELSLTPEDFADLPKISCSQPLITKTLQPGAKLSVLCPPATVDLSSSSSTKSLPVPSWVALLATTAIEQLKNTKSSILVVPDFRDLNLLRNALVWAGVGDYLVDLSNSQVKSARYQQFLRVLEPKASITIGTRAAIYAPAHDLGVIAIWDDGDESHREQASPYTHTREVALIRQSQAGCGLIFASHARSTEVQRLLEIKHLEDASPSFSVPKIAVSESISRVDPLAWSTIRRALESGPVLIQAASRGNAISVYCASCGDRSRCKVCNGPLWVDDAGMPKCRWCNALNLGQPCQSCGKLELRQGRAGATRTAMEFAKAFPGAGAVESNASNRIEQIKPTKTIVVATPGCEPRVAGGYAAVILLDAPELLGRDSLRATEDAVRGWSNAVALMSKQGQAVLVGVGSKLGQRFSLWAQDQIAAEEYATRKELQFPPAVRLASITGARELVDQIVEAAKQLSNIEILGPISVNSAAVKDEFRYLIKYSYAQGAALAQLMKAQAVLVSAGAKRTNPNSGRLARPVRICMDEPEVS